MGDAARDAIERQLRLAFYLSKHRSFTLSQTTADVPGYGEIDRDEEGRVDPRTTSGEAARRKFNRDLTDLDERFGIETKFSAEANAYTAAPPFFSPRERQVLLSAMALVQVAGIDPESSEFQQLGHALDDAGRRVVITVHEHIRAIRAAMAEGHPIRFRYHGRDRVLETWVIGQWRNNWYLVGREIGPDDRRVFRLDRIEAGDPAVEMLTDQRYEIPSDVEPRDELRLDPNDWGHDPPVHATIDVHPEHAQRFRDDVGGNIVKGDGDWVRIELLVRDYESFRDRVLRMGTYAKVHGPPEMVTRVREWLVQTIASA